MDWQKHKHYWPNAQYSSFKRVIPHQWHVQSCGTGDTILMLHGAGASTHTWAPIFTALSQTHHVVAIDLPGQGFTKLGNRTRCGLDAMTEDIANLLTELEITPQMIIGHSAGAAIALSLAADLNPQPTVVSINAALENFSGVSGILFPIFAKVLALNPASGHLFSLFSANETRVRKLINSTGSEISQQQLSYYRALVSDGGHVNATLLMMAQWSLERLPLKLQKITAHVHLMTAARDNAVPPMSSHRAMKHLENSSIEDFAELGHLMHEEDPDKIVAKLNVILARLFPASVMEPPHCID